MRLRSSSRACHWALLAPSDEQSWPGYLPKMTLLRLALIALSLAVVACTSPSGPAEDMAPAPQNTFDGEVAGIGLTPQEAVFDILPGAAGQQVAIYLADRVNLCGLLQTGRVAPGTKVLELSALRRAAGGETPPPDPGMYIVGSSLERSSFGYFTPLDFQRCQSILPDGMRQVTGGEVVLTEVLGGPGGRLAGTFRLGVGSQNSRVEGRFLATWCDLRGNETAVSQCSTAP